eukprot:TRINITY_DN89806_c0_g1_i1.p1 TRINITY_DN89806_c0_g1~~TRINITY_DN89806_c0_g1_i1.p1  ORF type:complete len:498 (-),score=50.90 TRINITY_DN89806_c0_g1_i1:53-1513(-)
MTGASGGAMRPAMVPRQYAAAAALALVGAIAAVFGQSRPSLAMATSTSLARPAPPSEVIPSTKSSGPVEVKPTAYIWSPRRGRKSRIPKRVPAKLLTTRREQNLRRMLNDGSKPPTEEFDRIVQVFAKRASQVLKYDLLVRRAQVNRAKNWVNEMLLQRLRPSRATVRVLLRGLAAAADIPATKRWIHWLRANGELGLSEWNSYIQAYGEAGRPSEIYLIIESMQKSSVQPDHRSYASLMRAWELLGNRNMMLRTLIDMRQKEEEGTLGASSDPFDAALPYYALARSYMRVGDAIRAMSVLKFVKDSGLPLSIEAYLIRLEVLLRVPKGPRRSPEQAKTALVDAIRHRPPGELLLSRQLARLCRRVMGKGFEQVLTEEGVSLKDLVTQERQRRWKMMRKSIRRAYRKRAAGTRLIISKENEDWKLFQAQKRRREDYVLRDTQTGLKRRVLNPRNLPEWMELRRPIVYGLGLAEPVQRTRSLEQILD